MTHVQINMELYPGLVESLEDQLTDGPVAFAHEPEDSALPEELTDAVEAASGGVGGQYAYVVIGDDAPVGIWARNMAELLLRDTHYDTVLVRGGESGSSAAASTLLSRDQIAAAHDATFRTEDIPASIGAFESEVEGATPPWTALFLVALVCLIAVVAVTIRSTARRLSR